MLALAKSRGRCTVSVAGTRIKDPWTLFIYTTTDVMNESEQDSSSKRWLATANLRLLFDALARWRLVDVVAHEGRYCKGDGEGANG